jgi:hypothetical protein
MIFKGKEKILIIEGEHSGKYGYVKSIPTPGYLSIVVENSGWINVQQQNVKYISSNYFLTNLSENLKTVSKYEKGEF